MKNIAILALLGIVSGTKLEALRNREYVGVRFTDDQEFTQQNNEYVGVRFIDNIEELEQQEPISLSQFPGVRFEKSSKMLQQTQTSKYGYRFAQSDPIHGSIGPPAGRPRDPTEDEILESHLKSLTPHTYKQD